VPTYNLILTTECTNPSCEKYMSEMIAEHVDESRVMSTWATYSKGLPKTCACGGYIVRSLEVKRD